MNILPTNPHRKLFITDNLRPKYPPGGVGVSLHLSTRIFTNEPTPAAPAPEQAPAQPHDHNHAATDHPHGRNSRSQAPRQAHVSGRDRPQSVPAPRAHTSPIGRRR